MNSKKAIALTFSALVLILFLGVGGWVGFHLTHPVSIATIELKVTDGPPEDTALKGWLSSQPVVIKNSVVRNNNSLTIKYKLNNAKAMDYSQTVVAQCKQLGYAVNGDSVSSNANPFLGTTFFPDTF
jgi:hypothetical protein